MHTKLYFQSTRDAIHNGCPATILKKRSKPSLRLSITSSENRFVKTFPGRGGIFTLLDVAGRVEEHTESFEIGVSTSYKGVTQFEGR
ncbi:hypothetical protein HHX47_DHR3000797, partial [Lentinula edodes]